MAPWTNATHQSKRHHHRVSRFSTIHARYQRTDDGTGPAYAICATWPNNMDRTSIYEETSAYLPSSYLECFAPKLMDQTLYTGVLSLYCTGTYASDTFIIHNSTGNQRTQVTSTSRSASKSLTSYKHIIIL